jgi:Pol polyprotein
LSCKSGQTPWIFDCGATDTMPFDPSDLLSIVPTSRTHIETANGECVSVDRAGSIDISPSLHLKNCLLVPSLSHKLLSISQLTKELNCIVIMSSTDCVV